ncbi:MerR family transcriptional regulator [Brachybacterium sp. P6-10-X1]|uniref:MerR family transcriptional regulator n=1 Tax=Brachybacterium sp. P6-10-X1 TaxID=1903186 RepID=UPI0009718BA5|nr:MerR family transcriptional regulator [Brachybacterium sp. P6-10-X1]APX33841.1 MerR family transcriptional regulator [Brachybacterium sp. P6-10-X1]
MLLHELSATSGCSAASIKYYRREGLLPAGERLTATRQEYGPHHLERLQLIQVLREMADAPIARIRSLTRRLDDPEVPLLRCLEEAQAIALGADTVGGAPAAGRPEHPSVAALLARMDWPDVDSVPRRALDDVLHTLSGWEMPDGIETVMRYAEPMARIARGDVELLQGDPGDIDDPSEPGVPGDDLVILRAVAGTIAFDRMIQVLRALGHVSLSVQASATPRE